MPVVRYYPNNLGIIDPGWTNQNNIKAHDGVCATFSATAPFDSNLNIQDFDFSLLPDDATIDHAYIGIDGCRQNGAGITFMMLFWIDIRNGWHETTEVECLTIGGLVPACFQSDETKSLCLIHDLGFLGVNVHNLKNHTFGFIEAAAIGASPWIGRVDCVWIEIDYSVPGALKLLRKQVGVGL